MRKHKPKTAYRNDPLVPIDRGLLRAAVELSGREVQAIAKEAKTTKQNLRHLMTQPGPGRCRGKLRGRLAKELDIPDTLLMAGLSLIEGWVAYALGADVLGGSRRGSWAALRLLDQVIQCAERDDFDDAQRYDVAYAVGTLLQPVKWRSRLIGTETLGEPKAGDATVALAKALNFALAPWLQAKQQLDLEALKLMANAKTVQRGGMPFPTPTTVFRTLSDWNELFGSADTDEADLAPYLGDK